MVFVPVLNTAEVEIRGTYAGEKVENTLWFENIAGWTIADLSILCADVQAWWIAHIMTGLASEYTLNEVHARDNTSPTGLEATTTPPSGSVGGGAAGLPGNVTVSISFRTGHAGRSFRGRNYVPAIPKSQQVTTNTLLASYVNGLASSYALLMSSTTITVGTWSVVSRFSGVDPVTHKPIPRATGLVNPVVATLAVDNNIDSQRRRLAGRGA